MSREGAAAVAGVAVELTTADRTRSLPELIFSCVSAALADAGCVMADVEAVTCACEDLIDGRGLSNMITGPAAGAYLRDETRLSEDGLAALSLAAAQIESGTFDRVLVAAWGRAAEGDPDRISAQGYDPFTAQPLGLGDMAVSALRASAYLRRHGGPAARHRADRDRAVAARQERAKRNPRANRLPGRSPSVPYPLRPADLRVESDAVAAVVLRRAAGPGPAGLVRITGIGHATESFHLGDRLLSGLPSARAAARHALTQAGRGLGAVDVVEVSGRTVWDEAQMVESIGLASPGEGFAALATDARLNPSGGSAAGDCEPASGLVRFAEAALQLAGRAGGVQLAGMPRVALVVSGAALAGQTHTAVVAEHER